MIQANSVEFKNHLGEFIANVQAGNVIERCKRYLPIAIVSPCGIHYANGTVSGCGTQTVNVHGDLADPVLESDLEMPGEFHNDLTGRIIVATARMHNLHVVTGDGKITNYHHVKTRRLAGSLELPSRSTFSIKITP